MRLGIFWYTVHKLGGKMGIDQLRLKVQRILTDAVGSVQVDQDGDYKVVYESAHFFIECWNQEMKEGHERLGVKLTCPLVHHVPVSNDLFKWIATEGSNYRFGNVYAALDESGKQAMLLFHHNIHANDLDASELENALFSMLFAANDIDTMLQKKFGGDLFGTDKE